MFMKSINLKNILVNLLLSVAVIIISLLVLEFITRTFWNVGYRHPYDWRSRIEDYEQSKDAGTFRLLLLGDSNAYGQGVRREETFGKLIENRLNKSNIGGSIKKYEVINLAWPGINSADEYAWLVSKGLNYHPDLILIAYCLNDLGGVNKIKLSVKTLRHPEYIRRPMNRSDWKWSMPIPESVDKYLTFKSDFYLFFMSKYDALLKRGGIRENIDHNEKFLKSYLDNGNDWKLTKMSLGKIAALSKQSELPLVLTVLPFFHEIEDYQLGEIHSQVSTFSDQLGFHVLDLLPVFIGKSKEELIVSRVDTHPNVLAHSIMAENIYNFLVENKLLKKGEKM